MTLLQQGIEALQHIPENHLPLVVRWLNLLTAHHQNTDVEPEELWLLAAGELEKLNREVENALPIDDWRDSDCYTN